jgi:hypothetical protein
VAASSAVRRVVVVGGGIGGARTVAQLRRRGYEGEIMLFGAESRLPYDRPPLSKAVLAGLRDDTALRFDSAALDVEVGLGAAVAGLDLDRRTVRAGHDDVPFDRLDIATGARPVRLPGDGPQLTLRTTDDALGLRRRLVAGARVVVIGASWIGAEVATAALTRGCSVTCLEAGPAPLAQALGPEVGANLLPWWQDVDLRLGTGVAAVEEGRVALADGSAIPADVVLTGVGLRPETGCSRTGGCIWTAASSSTSTWVARLRRSSLSVMSPRGGPRGGTHGYGWSIGRTPEAPEPSRRRPCSRGILAMTASGRSTTPFRTSGATSSATRSSTSARTRRVTGRSSVRPGWFPDGPSVGSTTPADPPQFSPSTGHASRRPLERWSLSADSFRSRS